MEESFRTAGKQYASENAQGAMEFASSGSAMLQGMEI
jgi:hypothetical protein